jgi:hypothetical protein
MDFEMGIFAACYSFRSCSLATRLMPAAYAAAFTATWSGANTRRVFASPSGPIGLNTRYPNRTSLETKPVIPLCTKVLSPITLTTRWVSSSGSEWQPLRHRSAVTAHAPAEENPR